MTVNGELIFHSGRLKMSRMSLEKLVSSPAKGFFSGLKHVKISLVFRRGEVLEWSIRIAC